MLQRDNAVFLEVWRSMTRQLVLSLQSAGYTNVYAGYVRRSLGVKHKTERKDTSSEFIAHFEAEGENLSRIIAAYVTWVHYFEVETKGQAMEWHHP